ncbi:MAG: homocysteine S-methyltransferase family protein [Gammaproteobacteria bacterium]|nr:homocysteine S-methyltransferase family protein [Gammaproteobacteria bacterium]
MGWQEKLNRGEIVLIDGGTGSELQRRGVPMSGANWSGLAVHTHPHIVQQTHEAYIEAGAEVIITNTFGSARFMLEAAGLGTEFESINASAVDLAIQAREASGKSTSEVAIAGSISNLPPNMNPGDYPDPDRELAALRELASLLADRGVDLIALEMMEDTRHAARAMEAALETGLPVWLGVSCRKGPGDSGLVSFDIPDMDFARPLDTLIPMGPAVVNIMHSELGAVPSAIDLVRERWDGPIGAYPEVGYFTAPDWNFDADATPDKLVTHAHDWVKQGARLIGGCCGTAPEHIRALYEGLPGLRTAT